MFVQIHLKIKVLPHFLGTEKKVLSMHLKEYFYILRMKGDNCKQAELP